jgi:hypothetical protein
LTDNLTNKQSDRTSSSSAPNPNKRRDRNDIVGRTSLPLPSLAGLEFFSNPREQETEPTIPVSKRERKATSQLAPSSTTEHGSASPDPFLNAKDSELQPPFLPLTTEARLRAVPARPTQRPPALPSSDQQEASQSTAPLKRIRLRPLILVGLLCLSMLGAFAYTQIPRSISGDEPVVVHQRASSDQQGTNFMSGSRDFSVGEYPSILIKGHRGNVSIAAGNPGSVIIKTNKNGKSLTSNSDSSGIQYTQSRDRHGRDFINIITEPGYSNVNYNVSAPSTALVKVEVDSGSIFVDGLSGVSINTTSGSLDIENVNGPIEISTENGDITVNNIKGQMAVETINGSIRGNNVRGQLKAVTQNGDVIVKQAALNGQSILKTQQGSVRFIGTLDRRGSYTMETHSGDVDLTLSALVAFQLHASTSSGSVSNEFGRNNIGDAPQAQITINIGSGSVVVKRAI